MINNITLKHAQVKEEGLPHCVVVHVKNSSMFTHKMKYFIFTFTQQKLWPFDDYDVFSQFGSKHDTTHDPTLRVLPFLVLGFS